jgi:cytochrome c551/c552
MYEDLVQQGVVNVARDAIMEPDTVVDDDDQERLDGYDLDENFSDDE